MIVEIAAMFVAVAFAVLVGFLAPALVELKRTIRESQQLLAQMNRELPSLLKALREMTANVNELADRTRGGVEHASGFDGEKRAQALSAGESCVAHGFDEPRFGFLQAGQ